MEEKMETQKQDEALAEAGAESIQEAVDAEIKQHAEEVVEAAKEMAQEGLPEGATLAPVETPEARIVQLKDELERLESGLPNAGAAVQAIRDKQQKVPRRPPNTPDVTPGNPDELAAIEMSKYAGALGGPAAAMGMAGMGMAGMAAMGMPPMAAEAGPKGPRGPVGVQDQVGPRGRVGPEVTRPQPPPRPEVGGPRTVQLDPRTLLEVELVTMKKRLAEANERLAMVALSDARKAKMEAETEEGALMSRISQQLNIPHGKNVRLVDKQKGICLIEG